MALLFTLVVFTVLRLTSYSDVDVSMDRSDVEPITGVTRAISDVSRLPYVTEQNVTQNSLLKCPVYINITISKEDADMCGSSLEKLQLCAEEGIINFNYKPKNISKEERSKSKDPFHQNCSTVVEVILPTYMVMNVRKNWLPDPDIFVYDSPDYPSFFSYPEIDSFVTSATNHVIFEFKPALRKDSFFSIHFSGVLKVLQPKLEITYMSPKHGFIELSRGERKSTFNADINRWLRVDTPPNNSVIISVSRIIQINVPPHYYILVISNSHFKGRDDIWNSWSNSYKPIVIRQGRAFFVHFKSTKGILHIGFRLNFSFHESTLPEEMPDGKWNCSRLSQTVMNHHFSCDMSPQCLNGEDELSCPYTSDKCGVGYITVEDSCFRYEITRTKLSRDEGLAMCSKYNSSLAILSTWTKWKYFSELLTSGMIGSDIPLGVFSFRQGLPIMYAVSWQWADNSIAYLLNISQSNFFTSFYGQLNIDSQKTVIMQMFNDKFNVSFNFLCEKRKVFKFNQRNNYSFVSSPPAITLAKPVLQSNKTLPECPAGHLTQMFFICDEKCLCFGQTNNICNAPLTSLPPSFSCESSGDSVPFTLVCDHRPDCSDSSDENFCVFKKCDQTTQVRCGGRQGLHVQYQRSLPAIKCVYINQLCDGVEQCADGSDEELCNYKPRANYKVKTFKSLPPPAVIHLDGKGRYKMQPYVEEKPNSHNSVIRCPETHFLCPDTGYCLPVFVRCNKVYDCPGHEDEADCDSYTCPGYYRCRASRVCLHTSHVCDGIFQCPRHDDELLCDLKCPDACTCHGLAFLCSRPFPARNFPELRYVNAGYSLMTPGDFSNNTFLVYLSLEHCGLEDMDIIVLDNLQTLDLSNNKLTFITPKHLVGFQNLNTLSLAGNPLGTIFYIDNPVAFNFPKIRNLDLSGIYMPELNGSSFILFPNLETLILKSSGIESVEREGLKLLNKLRKVDIRGCPIKKYPRDLFQGLSKLQTIFTDDYKLCCPAMLPAGVMITDCQAPTDELSSCGTLLPSFIYRCFLVIFAILSLLGNVSSLVYRVVSLAANVRVYNTFVTHLCVSDFLMGVYLVLIGAADWTYGDNYFWEDVAWKNSAMCKLAGFLALVSKEMSTFINSLLMIDQICLFYFPHAHKHFQNRSAHFVCTVTWCVCIALASVPFLPMTSHWNLYTQTDVCSILPITRQTFEGKFYSYGIMIILNCVLISADVVGSLFIFSAICIQGLSSTEMTTVRQDVIIAQRVSIIVLFNAMSCFPIVILGILMLTGKYVTRDITIAMATIVLPLSPALTTVLYCLTVLRERGIRTRDEKRRKRIMLQLFKINHGNSNLQYSVNNVKF